MADYREQEWMVNVPLYLVSEWFESAESQSRYSILIFPHQLFVTPILYALSD